MTDSANNSNEKTKQGDQRGPAPIPGVRRVKKIAASQGSLEGSAYQGALEAVFSIVVATLLGYWADDYFGTEPRYLIIGAIVGFASFVLRLMRMAKLVQEASQAGPAEAGTKGDTGAKPDAHPSDRTGSESDGERSEREAREREEPRGS